MSQNEKIAAAVVVVLVLAGAAYYWHQQKVSMQDDIFTNASSTLPSGTNTSDQSLNQDAAALDMQLEGLSEDETTVDAAVTESTQVQ